jgi:transposase-like protein
MVKIGRGEGLVLVLSRMSWTNHRSDGASLALLQSSGEGRREITEFFEESQNGKNKNQVKNPALTKRRLGRGTLALQDEAPGQESLYNPELQSALL